MKKTIYLIFVVILAVSIFIWLRPIPEEVETTLIQQQNFQETITIEGQIRAKDKKMIYAFATGDLESMTMKVGDSVKKGQILGKINWDKVSSIISPVDGAVSKILRESGGPIQRGEPILEISQISDLEVVVEAPTTEVVRLQEGGDVRILNWGGDGELKGQISQISRVGTVKISALGVEEEKTDVKIQFVEIPDKLKNRLGDIFHVDVVFIISEDTNALTIPLGALFKNEDQWAVYIVENKKAKLQPIKISKKNDKAAVVTSGLKAGDRVILFPGDKIQQGVLVNSK